jgi:hypothetical protein
MIITREQKVAMLAADKNLLFQAIKSRVVKDYQEIVKGLPEDMLAGMINHGIAKAKSFGLTHPFDIAGFVYIMFEVGPEFYRHPQIQPILTSPTLPPEQKMNTMIERTPPLVWQQCVDVLDRQTWFPELREKSE